jgi:predicted ATPase/DNA-binding CsgD family transcriptional regulator
LSAICVMTESLGDEGRENIGQLGEIRPEVAIPAVRTDAELRAPRGAPPGTVTFLVADLDPATRPVWTGPAPALLQAAMDAAAARHGGRRAAGRPGEGFVAIFDSERDAAAAAVALQRSAERELDRRVRVALHSGDAHVRDDGRYTGPTLRRAQRLRDSANGGQTAVSSLTASLLADALPPGAVLRDRGVHRLRDLSGAERIFELRRADDDRESQPVRSLDVTPHNLPIELTSFVGRRDELAEVHRLLAVERLLTITGPGGCGKTRLAAHAAADQAGRWRDGLWWVELAGVTDPALVSEQVATTLGVLVEPVRGALKSLVRELSTRRVLICLDNCEHVLDAAAEVARTLLETCPEIGVVATSREPLGVPAEVVWSVPGLDDEDALWLVLERGSQVRPGFSLEASNEQSLRTICARLDGVPLALELAAAWLRTLTAYEIERSLDDRFALLVRGVRGAAERQRTLAASIQWSYDLLDDADRAVFRALAVFAGDFDLFGARAVCDDDGAVLESLGRLVDKSLVASDHRDGQARYRLLESIREYAAARLEECGATQSVRDRHLDHYLALLEAAAPLLHEDRDRWRTHIGAEYDNIRAALEWGLQGDDPERGRRLAAGLAWLWHLNRHGDVGIELLQRAVSRAPNDRSTLQARLLIGIAIVADTAAPLGLEYDAAQRALEIATEHGDDHLRAMCLALSAVGRFYTDPDGAWTLAQASLRSAASGDEKWVLGAMPGLQAIILHLRDRHDEARAYFGDSIPALLRLGDRGVASTLLGFQALGELAIGEAATARALAERSVEVAEPLGDYLRVGMARSALAFVLGSSGDLDAGFERLAPMVRLVEGAGREVFVPGMARVIGTLCLWRGDLDDAARWLAPEAGWTGDTSGTYVEAQALPPLAAALRRLGRDDEARAVLDRALELARAIGLPRVQADALDEQARLSDPDQALDLHHAALGIRLEHVLRRSYPESLDALAALAASGGQPGHAARLLAAADRARHDLACPRPPVDQAAHDALLATLRATDGFADAWRACAGLSVDEAVGYARRSRGTRDRPASGWASLTPAERDVVRLAVEGLNNPEIGARLFMSRSTVKTHLSHVYAKLGVANRTELAAAAAQRPDVS